MNKSEYMTELLALCSEKQKEIFNRMYPNGPAQKQVKIAIWQISNTLRSGNKDTENLKTEIKRLKENVEHNEKIALDYKARITELEQQVRALESEALMLKNPVNTENADIKKRLIADEIQKWIDVREAYYGRIGMEVTDKMLILSHPHDITRGTLKEWVKVLREEE